MPGYCIHTAFGIKALEIAEKYISENYPEIPLPLFGSEDKKQFMAGLILPDAAKLVSARDDKSPDRKAHYESDRYSYFKTPDLNRYLKKHRLTLDSPMYIGYAMHLYLDVEYEKFLKGFASFTAGTVSSAPFFEVTDDERNVRKLTCEDFWKEIYSDYTKLNPYYKSKFGFGTGDYAKVEEFSSAETSEQIAWYGRLYADVSKMFSETDEAVGNGKTEELKESTVFLKAEQIDALINKSANDFLKKYLIPVFEKIQHNSVENVRDEHGENIDESKNKNVQWKAEKVKLDYYRKHWEKLVDEGFVDSSDTDFFSGVLQEIEDVSRNSRSHKRKHGWYTALTTYTLPVAITLASAFFTAFSNKYEGSLMCIILGIISTTLSALLTALSNLSEVLAHKETWLRQRLYYSMLMEETEAFCEHIDGYAEIDNTVAVRRYMDNIRRLRKKDYSNFFTNMGCTNFEKEQ